MDAARRSSVFTTTIPLYHIRQNCQLQRLHPQYSANSSYNPMASRWHCLCSIQHIASLVRHSDAKEVTLLLLRLSFDSLQAEVKLSCYEQRGFKKLNYATLHRGVLVRDITSILCLERQEDQKWSKILRARRPCTCQRDGTMSGKTFDRIEEI